MRRVLARECGSDSPDTVESGALTETTRTRAGPVVLAGWGLAAHVAAHVAHRLEPEDAVAGVL